MVPGTKFKISTAVSARLVSPTNGISSQFLSRTREEKLECTFATVQLDDVFMDGIVKIRLFPSDVNLMSSDVFESELWRRRDIQTELFYQNFIRSLTNLPGAVQQPLGVSVCGALKRPEGNQIGQRSSPDQSP